MCYGSNCQYEIKTGPQCGECNKPFSAKCPKPLGDEFCPRCGFQLLPGETEFYEICQNNEEKK